ERLSSEFRPAVERQQALGAIRALVMKPMQRDRGTRVLHLPHLLPEAGMRKGPLQPVILIVGDHGQDRADLEGADNVPNTGPSFIVHGGAKVVNPEEVLSRSGNFVHSCTPF